MGFSQPSKPPITIRVDSTAKLGLFSYVLQYFRKTRWPALLWLFLSLVLCVLASPLKPRIGSRGFATAAAITFAVSVIAFAFFVFGRVYEHLIKRRNQLPSHPRSLIAKLSYGSLLLAACLSILAFAENYSADGGLLSSVVSTIADLQSKSGNDDKSDSEPGLNSGATDQSASLWGGLDGDDNVPDQIRAELAEIEVVTTAPQRVAESDGDSIKDGAIAKVVVVEGVGATSGEAITDAFRSAVRQVVGIYVDSETLVSNDELIEDKVLTLSNGFVREWSRIPGSEITSNGLCRIKIKAAVERKLLVEKLQAVNVTLSSMDGQSMFAKAVTELDAQKDSEKLVKKALSELPTLLTCEIVDKTFDKESSEIVTEVLIKVDRLAYDAYIKRLEEVLKQVAIKKDSTVMEGKREERTDSGIFYNYDHPALRGPVVQSNKQWCIWVNNFSNATNTQLKWNGYVLEFDPREIIMSLEVPTKRDHLERVNRISQAKTTISVSAFDNVDGLVTMDEFELLADSQSTYEYSYGGGLFPFLRQAYPRSLNADSSSLTYNTPGFALDQIRTGQRNDSVNLFVSPYALAAKPTGNGWTVAYYPELRQTRRIKVTLKELERIAKLKCEVSYNAP